MREKGWNETHNLNTGDWFLNSLWKGISYWLVPPKQDKKPTQKSFEQSFQWMYW